MMYKTAYDSELSDKELSLFARHIHAIRGEGSIWSVVDIFKRIDFYRDCEKYVIVRRTDDSEIYEAASLDEAAVIASSILALES